MTAPLRTAPLRTAPLRTAPLRTAPLRTDRCGQTLGVAILCCTGLVACNLPVVVVESGAGGEAASTGKTTGMVGAGQGGASSSTTVSSSTVTSSSSGTMQLCDPSISKNCCDCTETACATYHTDCHSSKACLDLVSCNANCGINYDTDTMPLEHLDCIMACNKMSPTGVAEEILIRGCIEESCSANDCPATESAGACAACGAEACEANMENCWSDPAANSENCPRAMFCYYVFKPNQSAIDSCVAGLGLSPLSLSLYNIHRACMVNKCENSC